MSCENKSERQDASIITILSLTFAAFNLIGMVYYPLYVVIAIILVVLLILTNMFWFRDIYVKMNDKYKSGNSYVQRKFKTVGLTLVIFYYFMITFCYLISYIVHSDYSYSN